MSTKNSFLSKSSVPTADELDKYFELALTCAEAAGEVIRRNIFLPKLLTEKSSSVDIVTETDKQCETLVIDRIRNIYPHHKFIAEESYIGDGSYDISDEPTWFIDPVDGTTNFLHGFPLTCVSIGLTINKETVIGVVFNPVMQEMFTAVKGRGAFLNKNTRLQVSAVTDLRHALVCTEFGYDRSADGAEEMLHYIRRMLVGRVQGLRSMGSCALNMCFVAAGRFDLYYEGKDNKFGPKPWDSAAARLIVSEAGGVTADPKNGTALDICCGRVLATGQQALLDDFLKCVAI